MAELDILRTTADLRDTIKNDLELKYSINSDGYLRISYGDDMTIWILPDDKKGERIEATDDKEIGSIQMYAVGRQSDDMADAAEFQEKTLDCNRRYKMKYNYVTNGESCMITLERNEFLTPGYTRGQFMHVYQIFASAVYAMTSGIR